MKSVRYIYNDKYKKTKAMLQDEKFKQSIKNIKTIFARFDSPLPKGGFKDNAEYEKWREKYYLSRSNRTNRALYEKKKYEITRGKKKLTHEQVLRLRKLEDEFFPPLYGYIFDDILKQQGVDPNDEGYRSFLEQYVFFGDEEYFENPLSIHWIRNKDTDKMELFIQIFPHTIEEDIKSYWSEIKKDQQILKRNEGDHTDRNRKQIFINREIWIIKKSKQLKAKRQGKNVRAKRGQESQSIEATIMRTLPKRFGTVTYGNLRMILKRSRTKGYM